MPPQNFYGISFLISNHKLMGKMGNATNEGMLMPYKKLLEKTKNP